MRLITELLGSRAKIRLLRFLLEHSGYAYSQSELAKLANMPKAGVSGIIGGWAGSGLIKVTPIGNSKAVQLDDGFYLLPELRRLFSAPIARAEAQAKGFAADAGAEMAILYGSTARRDPGTMSDTDLLLVAKTEKEKHRLKEYISASSIHMTDISPVVMTEREVNGRAGEGDRFIRNILSEGVALKGERRFESIKRTLRERTRILR